MSPHETVPETNRRETVSETVFYGIAAAEDASPLDLQPLGEVIDADALDRFVESVSDSASASGILSFVYSGYEVTIFDDESVSLSEIEDPMSHGPH